MYYSVSKLLDIYNLRFLIAEFEFAVVGWLSAALWIEDCLIQHHSVFANLGDYLALERRLVRVVIVERPGSRQVG